MFQILPKDLPHPVLKFKFSKGEARIYNAKPLYQNKWPNAALEEITLQSRKTYLAYGDVPLIDNYDQKSSIYLANFEYTSEDNIVSEWVSLRFVPSDNSPPSTEDLDQCMYEKQTVGELLRQRASNIELNREAVTLSRMCGLTYVNSKLTDSRHTRIKWTPLLFALINRAFFEECKMSDYQFDFTTALFRPELANSALALKMDNKVMGIKIIPAEQFLQLQPNSICIDRKVMTFRYPGYFLNMNELMRLLVTLTKDGLITTETLKHYLGKDFLLEKFAAAKSISKEALWEIKNISSLLLVEGPLHEAKISGEELRNLINQHVSDGPRLMITTTFEWEKNINDMLEDTMFNFQGKIII